MIMAGFAVLRSHAGMSGKAILSSNMQLTEFEGYYQLDKNKSIYLQIMVKKNQLILKQLWDEREIPFEQKSALYFYNEEKSFPLTFSMPIFSNNAIRIGSNAVINNPKL